MFSDPSRLNHFRICLFGGPQFQVSGSPTRISTLQGALLGLLYGQELEHVSREEVISLIWPDGAPAVTRRRLNQLLYAFKKKTGSPAPFSVEGEEIHRVRQLASTDLEDFLNHLRTPRLSECVDLLSHGFLKRIEGQVSREYSDWLRTREGQLRSRLRRKASEELAEGEGKGRWSMARTAAEALLSLDPGDEAALQALMKANGSLNGFLDAQAAMEDFGRAWNNRSGEAWQPSQDTLSLLERLRSSIQISLGSGGSPGTSGLQEPMLVGRDEEFSLLRKTLYAPPHTPLRGILVSGEAGIGKTRLIKEALKGIGLEGQTVFWANLSELERLIPLNPFIEALRGDAVSQTLDGLDEPWRTVLLGVMPHHFKGEGAIPQAPEIQPGSVPRRLFEAVDRLLLRLAENEPTILVIEDLQWADDTTLAILEFLFRRWDRGRLQCLFSVRSEELNRNSTLRNFLDTLNVHEDFVPIQLKDLDRHPSQELIQSLSDRHLHQDEVAHLQSLAGGNPFFLIELTLEYLAGRVDKPVLPTTSFTIPLSIKQVLRRRLNQLSPESERILNAVAVHTRPISVRDLTKVTGIPEGRFIGGLDQLHHFRLIRNQGTRISPAHELIRQTVYQELNPSVRAWMHERVAQLLQESEKNPPPDELAVHYHKAGAKKEALRFAREAADHAEESGAISEALQFLGIAREHTSEPEEVADILGRMGHLHFLQHRMEEAAPLLEIAARKKRDQGTISIALGWELERVDALGKAGLLPIRECLEELAQIEKEAFSLEEWETLVRILDVRVHLFNKAGDLESIRATISRAEEFSRNGDKRAEAKANALIALNIYFGSAKTGLDAARLAVRIAERTSDNDLILHSLNRLLLTLLHQGLLNTDEGKHVRSRAENRSEKTGDLILKYHVRLNTGVWHLETRDLDRAEHAFRRAESVVRGVKTVEPLIRLNLNLGELHFSRLDIPKAKVSYEKAFSFLEKAPSPSYKSLISAGLGLCALHEGDLNHARTREAELPGIPNFWSFDPTLFVLFKARMLFRRGDSGNAFSLLRSTRREIQGRFVPGWIRLALEEVRVLKRKGDPGVLSLAEDIISLSERTSLHQVKGEVIRLMPELG